MNGNFSVFDPVQADGANVTKGQLHVRSRPTPAPSVAFDQVSVGASSAVEIAAAKDRYGFQLRNTDDEQTLYVGVGDDDPTIATGFPVPPGGTWSPPCGVSANASIKGISSSETIVVAFIDYLA